ncbi:MAG: PTS sugar transporter subunit IIB [Streptococcaceae bacterium]|jgi:PTS system mannose-specific IIB component|nr:PTS sugar transporter subunit IIB [Streptococcaceae bacterium]
MGIINLARVDSRLLHGQVATNLVKRPGVDSVFIVDDTVAASDMMKGVFKASGKRAGIKTIIFSTDKAKEHWTNNQFKDYNCILITGSIDVMHELITHGVPAKELNLGGIPQNVEKSATLVSKSVHLTKEEVNLLVELKESHGVENIYAQTVPSSSKTSFEDCIKKVK